ncbi:MAG TPA: ABC transporter ATP-binding protein [Ktedonobacteraceae bacterium]|jgi:peptide/nickel transport system ATP-binding protein|nr:ABC transporter ATP-binding protein [Ktedonobacteraceae bacterium]
MSQENEVLLEVNNICVDYIASNGIVHAVRDVSFQLRRGEILGLAGESGSGKSTLAYAIARLLRPPALITGGSVFYYPRLHESSGNGEQKLDLAPQNGRGGIDVLHLTRAQLQNFRWQELSIVFQSAMNALNPVLTVGTQIIDVLEAHQPGRSAHTRKKRAMELLEIVGIAPERLNSFPHELSGGMRQRVVIAIALALHPELIIMDEPTTALDVVVQREILELISSLCKELGTSLIFITHDLSLLLELADEVAVMYAGKIVERGSQRALLEHPRHPYTYGLMNSFPTLHGPRRRMTGIPGSPPDLRNMSDGCAFHERCPFAFSACQSVNPELRIVVPEQPDQVAACHLYDSRLTMRQEIPNASTFAQGYELQGERSKA